jgi:hypothetical protein
VLLQAFPRHELTNWEKPMKAIAIVFAVVCAASAAQAAPACKDQAADQKLSGAARTSFMNKCTRDACVDSVKSLSGAARTSSLNKCVRDACQARAADRGLNGAARDSFIGRCIKDTTPT